MRATIVSGGVSAMLEDNGDVELLVYDDKWDNPKRITLKKEDVAAAHNLLGICKILNDAEKK